MRQAGEVASEAGELNEIQGEWAPAGIFELHGVHTEPGNMRQTSGDARQVADAVTIRVGE